MMLEAKRRKRARGFADSPLDGMKAKTSVRDMRCAQILARRQQVLDSARDQGTQRDLKRQRADVDVVVAARAGVQVDAITSNSNTIVERLRENILRLSESGDAPRCRHAAR